MPARHFGKSVRYRVGVVGLERDQGWGADAEAVEVKLRHILRKSWKGIGNNSLGPGTGDKAKRGKRCLASLRLVQMCGGAEEGETRLIDRGGAERLGVADDKLLRPRWRLRGKTWHACCRQGVVGSRIVEVVIERPVARLTVVKVDSLSDLVVVDPTLLAIV